MRTTRLVAGVNAPGHVQPDVSFSTIERSRRKEPLRCLDCSRRVHFTGLDTVENKKGIGQGMMLSVTTSREFAFSLMQASDCTASIQESSTMKPAISVRSSLPVGPS